MSYLHCISIACHQFPFLISYHLPLIISSVYFITFLQFSSLISYCLQSYPITLYRIACHQFPSRHIVSPAISSHVCISYPLSSVPKSYVVWPAFSSHLLYRIVCHQFPSLYIVSPSISSHLLYHLTTISSDHCISYRLPSVPISYIISPDINSNLCISYRMPSVLISEYRIA